MKKSLKFTAITLASLFALIVFVSCIEAGGEPVSEPTATVSATPTPEPTAPPQPSATGTPEPSPEPTPEGGGSTEAPSPRPSAAPETTVSQEQAALSAQSYLDLMGMSRTGLVEQLEFSGYSTADATYGVDALDADYNGEAAESAQSYLDLMAFSRQGMVEQLMYDGFTPAQAEHGAGSVGL